MKSKIMKVLAGLAFASILAACGDSDSSSTSPDNVSVRDSVVIHDSLNWIDTVRVIDSLRIKDSVRVRDSLRIKDSVRVKDSIRFVDSLRIKYKDSLNIIDSLLFHYIDSLRYIDTLRFIDSIRYKDSTRVIDSLNIIFKDSTRIVDSIVTLSAEKILGKCSAENAGQLKFVEINNEDRSYYCDMGTHLWRIATVEEEMSALNDKYVRQSRVVDFVPLEDVLAKVAPDEQVIIVIRHAERDEDLSIASALTDLGVAQSQELGEKLMFSPEIYYAGSQYHRTHMTYNNIAKGRADYDTLGDTMAVLNEGWFTKSFDSYYMTLFRENDDGRGVMTRWAAEGGYTDVFYDVSPRFAALLENHLMPALKRSKKQVGMFVSHDVMIIPMVSYISERRITMKYYLAKQGEWDGDNWLNYLAGIAILFKPDGTRVFYAVKGLDSGTMKLPIE